LLGVGAAALLLLLWAWRKPAVLWLFLGGLAYLALVRPEAYQGLTPGLPAFALHWPAGADWLGGLWKAGLPQVPLTVLNSVLAVCALSADYFPGQGISPRRMAASVGLMNLLCAPLGGIPMCHGSGGLAAQVLFGARTGGSVVMLGLGKALAGLAFGGALLSLLQSYPSAILGVLLVFAGLELARAARESLTGPGLVVVL
ncbi:MAG TPA: putative sulfate/molybdate transporter, partial [Myxococcota bacterium]|nr:putative sulfate/molybdate transporter [Myxococcota bacterium]